MSSSIFSQFSTTPEAEVNGIWLDYGDTRVKIARAGGTNKLYASTFEVLSRPYRRAIQNSLISEEQARAITIAAAAKAIVKDWEVASGKDANGETIWKKGIPSRNGTVLEFSEENIIRIFTELPEFFNNVNQASQDVSLFRADDLEADAKN